MIVETFDRAMLLRLAGDSVFRRGESYAATGHVDVIEASATHRVAHVIGTETYRTEMSCIRSADWSCTCPYAEDGDFCKHCVALALVEVPERILAQSASRSAEVVDEALLLADFISNLPVDRLRQLVVEQVSLDGRLRTALVTEATAASSAALDRSAWRRRIIAATDPYDEYVAWREAAGWAAQVRDVLDALDDLTESGYGSDVIDLAEFAFGRVEQSMNWVDDSGGELRELSERVGEVHFAACQAAPPDPLVLAGLLVDMEADSELEGLYHAVFTSADLLGPSGLQEYRRLVETRRTESGRDVWALDAMHESVLEELADLDGLIALLDAKGRPGDHIRIVDLLQGEGRHDEAIERGVGWLENGGGSGELRDLVASLLRDRGDDTDALRLYVRAFESRPSVSAYQTLIAQPGVDDDEWYETCVNTARTWVASQPSRHRASGDVLVEMLLVRDRFDEAWHAGTEFDCSERLRLTVARAREAEHPLDAIELYGARAFRLIETKDPKVYESAIELIDRIRRCCNSLGDATRFRAAVDRARTEHRPKRNVQKLLDQRGW